MPGALNTGLCPSARSPCKCAAAEWAVPEGRSSAVVSGGSGCMESFGCHGRWREVCPQHPGEDPVAAELL